MEDKDLKQNNILPGNRCPEYYLLAFYALGECSDHESEIIREHAQGCERCRDIIAGQHKMKDEPDQSNLIQAPPELTEKAKALVNEKYGHNLLHVKAVFSRHVYNFLNTTGEIIFGPLSQPAALLREGQDDKRSNLLLQEAFDDLLIKVEMTRGEEDQNTITITATDIKTRKQAKNLRFTLLDNEDELESRLSSDGKAKFEEIKPGQYTIEINRLDKLVGAIRFQFIHEQPQ